MPQAIATQALQPNQAQDERAQTLRNTSASNTSEKDFLALLGQSIGFAGAGSANIVTSFSDDRHASGPNARGENRSDKESNSGSSSKSASAGQRVYELAAQQLQTPTGYKRAYELAQQSKDDFPQSPRRSSGGGNEKAQSQSPGRPQAAAAQESTTKQVDSPTPVDAKQNLGSPGNSRVDLGSTTVIPATTEGNKASNPNQGRGPSPAARAIQVANPNSRASGATPRSTPASVGPRSQSPFRSELVAAGKAKQTATPRSPTPSLEAQVARGLAAALRQKGGTLTLRLNPNALGFVKIQMRVEASGLQANIEASSNQARDLLEAQLPTLRSALEAKGLRVEHIRVSVIEPTDGRTDLDTSKQASAYENLARDGDSSGQHEADRESGDGIAHHHSAQGMDASALSDTAYQAELEAEEYDDAGRGVWNEHAGGALVRLRVDTTV